MFKKLFNELMAAQTAEEITSILYRADGVDRSFQKEKLSWQDHERLFKLAARLQAALPRYRITTEVAYWDGWCVVDNRDNGIVFVAPDLSYDACEKWVKAHA